MSHLLIVELPGGNDTDILAAAQAQGHRFSFLTVDAAHYLAQDEVAPWLAQAVAVIDVPGFNLPEVMERVTAQHRADPFDAILCLQDLRIVEAARIAEALGLRHLNPATAALARDKAAVRRHLAAHDLAQPPFARVHGPAELLTAIAAIGLPVMVKPVDGFGSQCIFAVRTDADLAALRQMPELIAAGPGSYGLGVAAQGAMLVERLLEGPVIGCDTMSGDGHHVLLGVNEKLFFPPPSFAIRGGCFTTNHGQFADIERYVACLLDAIGFDHGAAHIELVLTADGPQLIEINPRLVGARIARLISAARGRSVHSDLIALHTTGMLPGPPSEPAHAVTRWLSAPTSGILENIVLPRLDMPGAVGAIMLARPGDAVVPALDNADRLGCVITKGPDRTAAEALAERIISSSSLAIVELSL